MGIYVGANGMYNSYSGFGGSKSLTGVSPNFGAYGIFDIGKKWQIELGLGGILQDSKYFEFSDFRVRHDTVIHEQDIFKSASYITAPILAKYRIDDHSTVVAGARWAYATAYDDTYTIWYMIDNKKAAEQTMDSSLPFDPNHTDIGVILGYEFHFNEKLFASVLLNWGFLPIIDQAWGAKYMQTISNSSVDPVILGNYNRSLMINLNYNFWMK